MIDFESADAARAQAHRIWDIDTPVIGQVVHYVYGERHVPAIVTNPAFAAEGQPVGQAMTVFPVGELPFTDVAYYSPSGASATRHWPE